MAAGQKSIIIIGAGFAGAACAWWLARLGAGNIVVAEREDLPGLHASGLNAGMARRFEEDDDIAPLAGEGIDFILNPPAGFCNGRLVECSGSLLLNPPKDRHCEPEGRSGLRYITKQDAVQKVPVLADASFNNALWTPTDGVIDINAYLWAFINGAKMGGARFLFGKKTADINIGPGDIIVNSAGAWSQEVANFFGAEDMGIRSYRRHLYCTPPMPKVDPKWPFVWDVENQYYFRPESGGLLLGPADEDESPPGVPKTDPRIKEVLAGKLAKFCPALAGVSIAREWCGLRTFAPDKKPVIRWDRKVKDFFWLTALGGRGVTCAASAGRMAASVIMSGADPAKR